MIMKKITAVIIIFSLTISLFALTGCGKEKDEEDLSTKVENKSTAYMTDLKDSKDTLNSNAKIKEYLCNWADSKGIKYTTDLHDNVIMSVKTSKNYKNANPTVIICSYDEKQFSNCIEPMAMALYIVKNNESTGKLTAIFTSESGHDYSGITSINSKYFPDDANVFCLNGGKKPMFSTTTGAGTAYRFTSTLSYMTSKKEKAYKIKISGLPGGIPDSRISSYPNPIKELGALLAYFKTNSLIFDLAGINGGSCGALYPKSASATVVIDEDDFDKFQSRIDKAIENFNKDNLEEYPDAKYTYEEVKIPNRVFTDESLNQFVSLMYTLLNGVYYKDDNDNLISITSIGSIKCADGKCSIEAVSNSISELNMEEINNAYKTLCGLSNVKYRKTGEVPVWITDAESKFALAVTEAFNQYCGKEMEITDCVPSTNASFVFEKNSKCNIINVSVTEEKVEQYTGTIITFMMNQTHTEK